MGEARRLPANARVPQKLNDNEHRARERETGVEVAPSRAHPTEHNRPYGLDFSPGPPEPLASRLRRR